MQSLLFDLLGPGCDGSVYMVRTPKRGDRGYAAQLWTATGFWYVGLFPSIRAAREAAADFAATGPTPPAVGTPRQELPPNWSWRRSDGHRSRYRHVRRVRGGAYQARIWVGGGRSLNIGLFTASEWGELAEWAAHRAASRFIRYWKPGVRAADALGQCRADGVLPKRVVHWPAGWGELRPPDPTTRRESAADRRERELAERWRRLQKLERQQYRGSLC